MEGLLDEARGVALNQPMNRTSKPAVDRILTTLSDHLRASRRIGEIEAMVGRSRGYFSKVAAGKWRISIDVLMHTLEVLEIEPQAFFETAFAEPDEPEQNKTPDRPSDTDSRLRNIADLPSTGLSPGDLHWRR